jgi:hypothetical protein
LLDSSIRKKRKASDKTFSVGNAGSTTLHAADGPRIKKILCLSSQLYEFLHCE